MRKFRTYWERSAGGKGLNDNSAKATYVTYDYQLPKSAEGCEQEDNVTMEGT
jgi:hypothetical protein